MPMYQLTYVRSNSRGVVRISVESEQPTSKLGCYTLGKLALRQSSFEEVKDKNEQGKQEG